MGDNMQPDRIDKEFFNTYIEKNAPLHEKKYASWISIIIYLFLYTLTMILQLHSSSASNISGIISQFQVLLSVYLVVKIPKKGYITAIIVNLFQSFMVAKVVIINGEVGSAPGIVVPLCTIATISIISLFDRRLKHEFAEVQKQKEELVILYEEVAATEEELSQQNEQLMANSHVMRENEDKLNHLAFFDILTELPNRKMIINRLDLLISLSKKEQITFAVVFIDLDNFKKINDSMGHHAGDLLLQTVASKLKALLYQEDMLGRLGGDEFALIIQHQLTKKELLEYVEGLRITLLESIIIERTEFSISASFGISIYPLNGNDSTEMLKFADTAMYKAKEYGKNSVQFFCKEMKDEILKRIEFEKRLMSAMQNHELFLVFQPQYSASLKQLTGFEALVRWQSPELGFISPTVFIPVAEETGLIIPIGQWILRTACMTFKNIHDTYNVNLVIAVNISAIQIMEPSFVQMVKNTLEETGLSGNFLELEVTESIFITSMDYVVKVLKELKQMGIRIALDDFGTGYSSLSYLQMLPIDTLKIDKSFIDNINLKNKNTQVVGSIISLVHQMDISVVAEGVENELQLNYLKNQECDCIQGFLWGKPLTEENVNILIQQTNKIQKSSLL